MGTLLLSRGTFLKVVKNQRVEFFLLRGVNERGWRGVRSLLKPSDFLINKKIKFKNVPEIIAKYQKMNLMLIRN